MSQLTHTPLSNIELCYDGVHTPLTRAPIADLCIDEYGWYRITTDSFGNSLTYENSKGGWYKYTRDSFGNELSYETSTGFWYKYTRDSKGNELTFENSIGNWYIFTRDSFGNVLFREYSNNNWCKYTRDSEGNLLTCEDKNGIITYMSGDKLYGLYYQDGLYKAGCHKFTYDQAIEHWTERAKEDNEVVKARAVKFLATIEKHHEGLTK